MAKYITLAKIVDHKRNVYKAFPITGIKKADNVFDDKNTAEYVGKKFIENQLNIVLEDANCLKSNVPTLVTEEDLILLENGFVFESMERHVTYDVIKLSGRL